MKTGGFPEMRSGRRASWPGGHSGDTPHQIHAARGSGPVGVIVARAARRIRPLTLTGAVRAPGGTGALRTAEVMNDRSDGGACEPFH